MVSIIVPTLNEEAGVAETLRALRALTGEKEIIIADGGSSDSTVEIARNAGAEVIEVTRGRGSQLHAGAQVARGDIFWFVHADTVPPQDALAQLENALAQENVAGGNFGLLFDGGTRAARQLTAIYPWLRPLNLCYGDASIFLRRSTYQEIGGFRAWQLFEDLDLLRKLRRKGRFAHLECRIVTSSRRFENRNFFWMWMHWTALQVLWWCGANPDWLARSYRHVRQAGGNGTAQES